MNKRKKEEHWAFDELRKKLSEKEEIIIPDSDEHSDCEPKTLRITKPAVYESEAILLFKPSLKVRIHNNFYNFLYPKILEVIENSPLKINKIDEIKLIENTTFEASCLAYFSLNDPKRPFGISEEKWWNIGFELKISDEKYLLDPRLSIAIPY
jgi:hypothetical protein